MNAIILIAPATEGKKSYLRTHAKRLEISFSALMANSSQLVSLMVALWLSSC